MLELILCLGVVILNQITVVVPEAGIQIAEILVIGLGVSVSAWLPAIAMDVVYS